MTEDGSGTDELPPINVTGYATPFEESRVTLGDPLGRAKLTLLNVRVSDRSAVMVALYGLLTPLPSKIKSAAMRSIVKVWKLPSRGNCP